MFLCPPDSPEFLKRPGQLSGEEGQEVLLECLAQSNPAPDYKWFRNGNLDTVKFKLKLCNVELNSHHRHTDCRQYFVFPT